MQPTGSSKESASANLTLPGLMELYDRIAMLAQAQIKEASLLVSVHGVLGSFPNSSYPTYYNVALSGEGQVAALDISKGLVEQMGVVPGDEVRVTGLVIPNIYQQRLGFRIQVSAIELVQSGAPLAAARDDRAAMERIKAWRRTTQAFPDKESIRVSVICSRSSQVYDDFIGEVQRYAGIDIERIDCSMHDPAELTQAVLKASGNVVALIRGGGPREEFAAFDDLTLVEALSSKPAYRVTGLGHSEHTAAVCLVSDSVASTPTAAGAHIAHQFRTYQSARQVARLADTNKFLSSRLSEAERKLGQQQAPKPDLLFKEKLKLVAVGAGLMLLLFLVRWLRS